MFSSKAQLQPVVGDVGMRRQILLERLRQLMRDVDEISFFGLNARCDFERLRDTQMSRVWLLPQRIDDQTFNAENLLRYFIRHRAAIAEISDEITSLSEHRALPCAPSGHFVRCLRKHVFPSRLQFSGVQLRWAHRL